MAKRALITGITGQDGSYLAELLLSKGYEVHGLIRRASSFNTGRLEGIYADPHQPGARLKLHYGDLSDASGLARLLTQAELALDERDFVACCVLNTLMGGGGSFSAGGPGKVSYFSLLRISNIMSFDLIFVFFSWSFK